MSKWLESSQSGCVAIPLFGIPSVTSATSVWKTCKQFVAVRFLMATDSHDRRLDKTH